MPTYTFRIRSDEDDAEPVQIDLQTHEQARREAVRTAAGVICEHGPAPVDWAIEAKDELGSDVARVRFTVD